MKLEEHLVLNKYFLNLFGFNDFNQLRENLKKDQEGYDSNGRSFFVDALIGFKPEFEESLLKYDETIKEYVRRLGEKRNQPNFSLKYFQYLAVLFTEIFLDRYYNDRQNFLGELNRFLDEFNESNKTSIPSFTEEDLKKLAFWMATGSGKTIIMHINYWQALNYFNQWNNIILITPNEGLSRQHYEELRLSGIPCKLYDGNNNDIKTENGEILIIDIYKLTKEKKGKGVSVDISWLIDGKSGNLVFIDEGHKGQTSEEQTWKRIREEIGKEGFIFEYSATFGQIIGKEKDLLEEYAKAIIFDYSYKYFYTDGYGKDFYVYNIKAEKIGNKEVYSEEQETLLLTAGLLSFYEQLEIFETKKEDLKDYNIEKPLWIFVGSKVTGSGIDSDVVRIVKFLDKITKDGEYLKENVKKILEGKSGLMDNNGNDIFQGKFEFIRNQDIDTLTENIYQKVFGGKGNLELYEIKNASGEIGLKTSTTEKYFGVINVGDVNSLKNLISTSQIEVKQDQLSQSLFFEINKSNSPVNILIGSKKFIEGWNSWRVSTMGLINMGKGEGPQIIQLFGRGVRLKGKNYSLKREGTPDYEINTLQTLFIFGLNADYINAFLSTIEEEGIDDEEIIIPIKFNEPEKWENKIYTIETDKNFDFTSYSIKLVKDDDLLKMIKIDLRPRITLTHGLNVGGVNTTTDEVIIPEEYFNIIDWNSIYSEIINYKIAKGMYNLVIETDVIKEIATSNIYKIFLTESEGISIENKDERLVIKIKSFEGIRRLHDIILMVLKDYIQKFYKREEKKETMNHLEVEPLTISNHSYMYPEDSKIILKIPKTMTDDIKEAMEQLQEYVKQNSLPQKWQNWDSFIIHFDNHLYTPLIIWKENKEEIKSVPVKLNQGETKFLEDFKNFLNRKGNLLGNCEVFLLRNLSRKGIGFFINSGFYPDFIIWIKRNNKQHIIFIDPKGIRNLGNFNDDKIQLCTSYIKEIERRINEEAKNKGMTVDLQLDAFIISTSSYDNIAKIFGEGNYKKADFENHNIFFQEKDDYIKKVLEKAGVINSSAMNDGLRKNGGSDEHN
ncbi:DEAD/DEAH box helicase family protein [Caldisericum exile]|uniref:DEAD/DEAH box helicase family protein n=1 Tax=Caldisericum exile TaxID=693075 RepID=UPI003C7560FD